MGNVPVDIDVLDLFCGNGRRLLELARRHPKKTFVGVDKAKRWTSAILPRNVDLVNQDVLEFLKSRRKARLTNQVVIDYGIHHLPQDKRTQLYRHLVQLIVPGGYLHITTYNQSEDASPKKIISEAESAGFKLHSRKPLIVRTGASQSQYSALQVRGRLVTHAVDALFVPTSTRLHFRVPRKREVLAARVA